MEIDTIIYAVVAILVFAKLWSVLGQKNEGDPDNGSRPNPFAAPSARKQAVDDEDAPLPSTNAEGTAMVEHPPLLRPMRVAPESVAGGHEQIKELDPGFDEKAFLQGAKSAFTLIVGEFASGDMSRSATMLGPHVKPAFDAAIKSRQGAGQSAQCKINRIREAETVRAKLEGTTATIVVRFVSEQENILRDTHGTIIHGQEGKTEEITDIWTFARDLKASDPNWILVETTS